jgi:hypothetical protein
MNLIGLGLLKTRVLSEINFSPISISLYLTGVIMRLKTNYSAFDFLMSLVMNSSAAYGPHVPAR